jgi:NTP pyrophosphatase (non-canonical NTP hydrolase)
MKMNEWLEEFADWTITTARYPEAGTGSLTEIKYLVMGMCGEIGECLNARKKMIRDGVGPENLTKELADVLWYVCRLSRAFEVPVEKGLIYPREDLDKVLLELYSESCESVRSLRAWLNSPEKELARIGGLSAVIGAVLVCWELLEVDPELAIKDKQAYLAARTDQGKKEGSK